jgi:phosphoglycerate dehydrogenase-like enzyme
MQVKIAVLDDYQDVALKMADWSGLADRAQVDVYNDHLADPDAVVKRLHPYDIVCVMRERTPLNRGIIERLPNLKLIASTGPRNASIDLDAAAARGIKVVHTGYFGSPTVELTWALILGSARHVADEAAAVRRGEWQHTIGDDLSGQTLGILGLGNLGSKVAQVAAAFGMKVIAWSQNLTAEKAVAGGAALVLKDDLLRQSDFVSIHLVLSERTRGLIGARELSLMKPSARLINTSRGPIVVEADLIQALNSGKIAGAAIDVYDTEPLPPDHPYRRIGNLLATPHIGYVSRRLYERFYRDSVSNILAWLDARG